MKIGEKLYSTKTVNFTVVAKTPSRIESTQYTIKRQGLFRLCRPVQYH